VRRLTRPLRGTPGRWPGANQAEGPSGDNGGVENTIVLPVAGEASDSLVTLISGGQPVLLVRNGRPVAVVIDVDSYEESEDALAATA
jgi:hypothetical protein